MQVSPLWRKSWSQPQLNETDLLQLPYRNRAQGVALEDVLDSQIAAAPDRAAHHGDGRLLETSNETFTPWGLLYHVWRRNLGLVLWGKLRNAYKPRPFLNSDCDFLCHRHESYQFWCNSGFHPETAGPTSYKTVRDGRGEDA